MNEFDEFEPAELVEPVGPPPLQELPDLGFYRGFRVVSEPPGARNHAQLQHRFYVSSPLGAVGLVPWPGSTVIWPWEAGYAQDLHRPQVQGLLKEVKEKKK